MIFGLKRVAAVAISCIVLSAGTMGRAETLADAMVAAYRNSHLLEQNRALLAAADEDVALAVSALRPIVQFVYDAGRRRTIYKNEGASMGFLQPPLPHENSSFGQSLQLSFELMMYDSGRSRNKINIAQETVLATRAALVGVEQDVLLNAVRAYVLVGLSQEIVELRSNNVNLLEQELRATQDRFDVGEVTNTDVALAQSQLAQSQAALANAEGDLLSARERYKAAIGHYPAKMSPLPKLPRLPKSLKDGLAIARRGHPNMIRVQHLVKAADYGVAYAEADLGPTLGVQGTVSAVRGTSGPSADIDQYAFELRGSQMLYSGGRYEALLRKAQVQRNAQRADLQQTRVTIEQNLGTTWANLDVADAQIAANIKQIEAAQIAFDGMREEAKLGARTTLDVLDAEQDLLDARSAKLQSEAERYYAVYDALAAMGRLTVQDLNLGIPTYDVTNYYNYAKDAPPTSLQGESLDRVLKALGKK